MEKMACLLRYVRALGALYMRLVGTSLDCYKYLEPLYLDYRKLKMLNKLGGEWCLVQTADVLWILQLTNVSCNLPLSSVKGFDLLPHFKQQESNFSYLLL